jgi:HAE1 family hydrophobic/amphiphilic exporter-1
MLAASMVGIFLIPMLYVVMQRFREKVHGGEATAAQAPEAPAKA